MDQRKALKSTGLALLLVLVTLPQAAGTSEGEASVLARKVLDSTTIEWSQAFCARGSVTARPR